MCLFVWYNYLKSCVIDWYRKLTEKCAYCGAKGTELIYHDGMSADVVVCDECFDQQFEMLFGREDDYGES